MLLLIDALFNVSFIPHSPLDGGLWRSARSERAPQIVLVWGDLGVPAMRLRPISTPMAP